MATQVSTDGETQGEFAKRHGVSRQRISVLVKQGLPRLDNGRIDSEAADAWMASNLDHARRERQRGGDGSARERKEAAQAALTELDLARRRGELVERAAVEQAAFERARLERDGWLTWVAQVAPTVAAELGVAERDAFSVLDRLVRSRLSELSEVTLEDLRNGDR